MTSTWSTIVVTRASHMGRAVAWVAIVTTIPAIVHTYMLSVWGTEVISESVVVSMASMTVPSMTTTIGSVEVRTSKVEVVTVWVTTVDTEVPVTSLPVQRTIEVTCCNISVPLPVEQDVA